MAADHGLALPHAQHRTFDGRRRALAVDEDERVVGLEQSHAAGVEAQHPAHAIQHEVQDLLHGFARRLGDQLVHERVALGLSLAQRDRVGARELRAGAADECHAQTPVVIGEAARLVAEQHESTDTIADHHGQREQALDGQLIGHVVDELRQPRLVRSDELLAGVDRSQQRPGVWRAARHGLRMQPAKPDPRWLGQVLPAVGGDEVVASERGSELLRETCGESCGVARLGNALGVLRSHHEGAVLLLQLGLQVGERVVVARQRVIEAAVGGDPGQAAERQQQKAAQLEGQGSVGEVEVHGQERHQKGSDGRRSRDGQLRVEGSGHCGQEAGDRGHQDVGSGTSSHVHRSSGQDKNPGRGRKSDPHGERRP